MRRNQCQVKKTGSWSGSQYVCILDKNHFGKFHKDTDGFLWQEDFAKCECKCPIHCKGK